MARYLSSLLECLPTRLTASIILASVVTVISFGCTSGQSDKSSTKKANELAPLNIAVIPSKQPDEQEKALKPLADHLTKTLGRQVNFQIAKDYQTPINLLAGGKVEMAYLGPLGYVEAKQLNAQIQPIVAPIDKNTGRPWYTSVIVANSTNGIQTIEDLKGKRFGFVSESSTSGYLMPLSHFKDIGIDPGKDFATVKYSGSHDKVKEDLAANVVDAIADDKPSYLKQQKAGKFNSKKYKIIWESAPIPQGPIVILSNKVPPQLITDLKKAFVSASEGLVDVNGAEAAGFTLVQDEDYEPIRKLQQQLQLKPGQAK